MFGNVLLVARSFKIVQGGTQMNTLRPIVVGLAAAVSIVLSSGGAALAASAQPESLAALDYEGSPIVTYAIVNAWPQNYTGVQPR